LFGTDVLLSIPTESVAVRAVVASVAGLLLVRLLLALTVRQPRLRAAAVLVPTLALVAVVAGSWGDAHLPSLMIASEADNAFALPFLDHYLRWAPVTWPAAAGLWGAVATVCVSVRLSRTIRARRTAAGLFTLRTTSPGRLSSTVETVAAGLRVPPPPTAVGEVVHGGASVIGIRHPVLLVDRELLATLDDQELEGLVAHELAHVRRRDNLVALLAGVCRDLAFFVPGGRWVIRQLHYEREAAADALAVEVTNRPGALASGLLKAIESRQPVAVGAAFSPGSTLESRVRRLCADTITTSSARRAFEGSAIAGALVVSVTLAIGLPAWLAHGGDADAGLRYGLAVLWSSRATDPAPVPTDQPTAFAVYRDTGFVGPADETVEKISLVDDGRELNPALLRLDPIDGTSPAGRAGWWLERPSLGLTPSPPNTIDAEMPDWRGTSLLEVDAVGGVGVGVYLLSDMRG